MGASDAGRRQSGHGVRALATVAALAESGRSDEGAFERRSRLEHVSDTREQCERGEW